jgi:hypothetical protein
MPNVIGSLANAFPWMQQQNQNYRQSAQDNMNSVFGQGGVWGAMTSGLGQAMNPTVSPQMLQQLQGAGRDRVAREGQSLQDALHAQLAAQGMQTGMYNPSYMGAQYNTAYQAGQSDINQQLQASQLNQQGLLGALGAGQGMLGAQVGAMGSFNDLLGQFSQGDSKFYDLLTALLGAKMGAPKKN